MYIIVMRRVVLSVGYICILATDYIQYSCKLNVLNWGALNHEHRVLQLSLLQHLLPHVHVHA